VKSALKTKYAAFIESLESTCKQNPKRFWTFFKSKTKTRALPSVLCDENTECIHARDKAHLFNNYFAQVFNDDSETVIPLYDGAEVPSIVVPCFTTDDIKSVLKSLNVNKACAPGDVSQLVLKKCCDVLAPSLSVLFNVCLSLGVLPLKWKKTDVIPIFKNKGDKSHVKNYRPISLLATVSKVLERSIFNKIYPSLVNKIHPLQHGFVKGRSCATQLLKVYH
jgi:hypothetical protein